jgi:hypothetical protein
MPEKIGGNYTLCAVVDPWHDLAWLVLPARNAHMSKNRRHLNWLYDDENQQFTTPSGSTVTLQEMGACPDKAKIRTFTS